MAPLTSLPDSGLNTDDIRYFSVESVIRGRGPDRLRYLDLEGRWNLSGKSIPYISSAFNQLERLNDARVPFRGIAEEPINAIGMVGWTPSSEPAREVEERRPPAKFKLPVPVVVEDEVPPSPRERMPHRTVGYGPAHQKRKLSIPDRSRSVSPLRAESPIPTYDRYTKYERNRTDSMTRYGTKWGMDTKSGAPSPKESADSRPPHRTPSLSPRTPVSITSMHHDFGGLYGSKGKSIPPQPQPSTCTLTPSSVWMVPVYSRDSYFNGTPYKEELRVMTREQKQGYVPYRSGGYGAYHEKRQYELSPRSIGSAAEYTSGSEQSSPASMYDRNADEIMLMEYHSRRTTGTSPRRERIVWAH